MFLANALRRMRSRAVRSRGGSRHAPGRRSRVRHLVLEALEDRCLLSNFTLGPLVQVSVTDPFAGSTADDPNHQSGHLVPDSEVEPYVAVDPRDPNHLVGIWQQDFWSGPGSRGMVVGVTFDGGRNWQEVVPPGLSQVAGGPFQRASDDWLSFAPNGDLYLSALSFNTSDIPPAVFGESTVMVSKSTDGGLIWSNPVIVTDNTDVFNDKDVLAADPSNPNIAYLIWVQNPHGSAVLFSRTTDGGQTWEPARVIHDEGTPTFNRPVQIVVEPDGTLVYFSTELRPAGSSISRDLIILRSTDQGETWQGPIPLGRMETIGVTDPDNGASLPNGPVIYAATVDPTNGNLYAVWRDARFNQGQHDSIAFAMSTDGGLTWSQPIQINQTPTDVPAGDQQAFTPSIAVAADGTVGVTYYDFRFNDPSPGLATDYWFVRGNPYGPGGLTNPANWGDELRLTDSSFDMEKAPDNTNRGGHFLGDYQGLAAIGNGFAPFFARPHGTDPDSIFFRRIDELATVTSVVVNDGAAQRSMVTSVTVTFSTVVHLDPGAFALVGQDGGVIQLQVAQAVVDGHSVDTLPFSGAGIIGGSLADGHYVLTIHGGLVHDGFGNALDGAGTGTAGSDRVDTFFRLFGDADGDGVVDERDRALFRSAFKTRAGDPGYLWYFDYDGDGAVDGRDNGQFNRRFGHP
jgi:hypothetical protein